ncbi:retrovirus-related pol polyprotein from transposon TNT 1-94 [Tanacetum coccineum]
MSQDVFLSVVKSITLNGESVNVELQKSESCGKCFNLDAEFSKTQNAYNDLFEKKSIKSTRENAKEEKVNYDKNEIKTINVELENSVAKLLSENKRLCKEINHVKQGFKDQFDSIKKIRVRTKEQCDFLIDKLNLKCAENEDLKAQIQDNIFVITSLKNDLRKLKGKEIVDSVAQIPSATTIVPCMFKLDLDPLAPRLLQNREAHIDYLKHTQEQANILQGIVEQTKAKQTLDNALDFACSSKKAKIVESKSANNSKPNHTWGSKATDIPSYSSLVNDRLSRLFSVRFGNDQIARIIGYGDYQLGNVIVSRVYYVDGLGHNLFSIGQFCDADLEVAFRKNTCFIRNLEGVDLLLGSRDTNLYTISFDDMLKTSPICLLSKASQTKSWLRHRQLSHLNFSILNKLAKDGLARGIPKLKF